MALLLSEVGKELQTMVREFCAKEIIPHAAEWDEGGIFPEEMYAKAFAMGLHTLEIPEKFGGMGLDVQDAAGIYEELGKADASMALTLSGTCLALKPVLIGGTPEQIQFFSNIIIPGNHAAFCLTEPASGSDAGASRTTAVREGDDYYITGSKCFITNAAYAKVFIVFASTDKSRGTKGLSAFLVPSDAPGITVGKHENKMGIRASNTCDVFFDNVRVPVSMRLGNENEGFKYAMLTLDLARPFVGAVAVGLAQRALDEAIAYSKIRVTFGKPICQNQAIQFMLADMDMKIETARQMNMHVLEMYKRNLPYTKEAAIAKCYATDVCVAVATDAVQILGGYGYSKEYPVEKLYRDAKVFQIFEGTNQIQRTVIAGALLR